VREASVREDEETSATAAPEVRLLVLCAGDPEASRPFSGSSRSLIRALTARGCVHHAANVLGWSDGFARGPLPLRLLRRMDRFGLESRYQWSNACWAANTRRAHAIARSHPGFNACFMYGTTYHPALNVPTYCYFDATAAQVAAAKAWEFAHFSEREIARIVGYQRGIFEDCTTIFPRTHWAAESVTRDYAMPPEKVLVAGAGPNHAAAPLPHVPYDNKTILFVGIEFERKGGPLLVEAFRQLRTQHPDARLRIVGCTPEIDEPGVEVIGHVSKDAPGGMDRLLQLYSEAAIFCIMSEFEPFGIVMLEAQNSAVPCVAPARFAFPEIIADGVTGRLVPDYDPATLAGVLGEMFDDPEALARMGAAAQARAREEWTWAAAAARIHARIQNDLALYERKSLA
jgi:glycosyltransferase involved in cell wall biosynthesis